MESLILWGTGKVAAEVFSNCTTLNLYNIKAIIDNDPLKWNTEFCGIPVYSPDILKENKEQRVVILSAAYKEIKEQIEKQYRDYKIVIENKNYFYKESLIRRYVESTDAEIMEVIENINQRGLDIFNYPFAYNFENMADVQIDEEIGLYYIIHQGKKMYFPATFETKESVMNYYNSILLEQHEKSPHRYLSHNLTVEEGDVVVDVGTAEGNFAIEVVDKVAKLYLIEADENWIKALKYTFKDYSDKVVIIKGFVSSYCDGNTITLDSVIHTKVNFIKMDIEGNEWDALQGAEKIIKVSSGIKFAICSYHSDFDQDLIEYFMDKHNIKHWTSKGYMWFPTKLRQTYVSTRLNRGIVFGMKR